MIATANAKKGGLLGLAPGNHSKDRIESGGWYVHSGVQPFSSPESSDGLKVSLSDIENTRKYAGHVQSTYRMNRDSERSSASARAQEPSGELEAQASVLIVKETISAGQTMMLLTVESHERI